MKYLSILVVFVLLVGCGKVAKTGGSIITINNCQYAIYNANDGVAMVHAGNCNNPEHKQSQTLGSAERLVTIDTVGNRLYFRPTK